MSELVSKLGSGQINPYYTLTITEDDQSSRQISLDSLKDASVFDEVKHRIDQSHFFSLIDLVPTDYMLQCRKAELLIYIEEDDEAFALLKDNPLILARGLEAKLYISQNKFERFENFVAPYFFLTKQEIINYKAEDKEGLIHLYEMTAIFAYYQKNLYFAKYFLDLADILAEDLKMKGRLGVIHSFAAEVYRQLNIPYRKSVAISGNYKAQEYKALINLRHSWLTGKPKIFLHVPDSYKYLVKAWQCLQEGRFYSIIEYLKAVKSNDLEVLIHKGFLAITFISQTGRQNEKSFNDYICDLQENIENYSYINTLIAEIIQLYPLAVLLTGELIPRLAEISDEIPILVNEKYRDGLRWKNQVIVLPVYFRKAWLEDDIDPSHVSHLRLIDKSTRHRALKTLRKNKILKHQIVSVASYYKACENLSHLGYEKYEILRQKLKKLYPKSLADL